MRGVRSSIDGLGLQPVPEPRAKMTFVVYIEIGQKRTFAGAVDWPGWCRSGTDESSALQALLAYGHRYQAVLRGTALAFNAPDKPSALRVVERLKGTTTTDFGSPAVAPRQDADKLNEADLLRHEMLLKACWAAFDAAVRSAKGQVLHSGPRGGGRDLTTMIEHVREAEAAYVAKLGWPTPRAKSVPSTRITAQLREAALEGLRASAAGHIPSMGLRGGKRWTARYFVRRTAWHVLDHGWEIEDRLS